MAGKSKGGRPRKLPGERRSESIRADLTIAEKQELQLEARLQGISEAELVRRRLGFGGPAPGVRSSSSVLRDLEDRGVDVAQLLSQDAVRACAEDAGLEPVVFVRRMLEFSAATPGKRNQAALVSEINAIGVNLNQLTRATHRGSEFVAYWREVGAKLEDTLERVLSA